jgi:sugar phosphate isomerase/epimerase
VLLGYANHPRRDVLDEIEWIGRNGFDFVDLFLEPDKAAIERLDAARIAAKLQEWRLPAVGHTAYYLPIGSPLVQLREAAAAAAVEYARFFRKLEIEAVTIHAHWPPGMFSTEEGADLQVETLRSIVERTKPMGIDIMYEPIGTEHDEAEVVESILARVPGLSLHLDLGHANLCGRSPETVIRYFSGRIRHIHLHDNNGMYDQHLPPGTGRIDWPAVAQALKAAAYDGTVTLEVFSPDRDYVLLARDKARRILGLPERDA